MPLCTLERQKEAHNYACHYVRRLLYVLIFMIRLVGRQPILDGVSLLCSAISLCVCMSE